jgi:hypothetical protein
MRKILLFGALICAGMFLNAQIDDCASMKTTWKSEKEAIDYIENQNFMTKETIDVAGSSWLNRAEWYSCDAELGYLIVKSGKKSTIHQNVPISDWEGLKNARSKGGFYNFYIKDRYELQSEGANEQLP